MSPFYCKGRIKTDLDIGSEEGGRKIREIKWEQKKTFYLTQGGISKKLTSEKMNG